MSYTVPEGQPQGEPRHFTDIMREILVAELAAINGYMRHIENSNMEDVNKAWHHIMLDEKKHYGWMLLLLRKYDPQEYGAYLEHKSVRSQPEMSPMQQYKPEYDRQIILNNIRDDIEGELEAVILYDGDLPMLPYQDIVTTLQNIISEEKGHTEHLTELLLKYDPDPYNNLD